jgi:hypothetical protein
MWCALSDDRRVCSLQLLLGFASAVTFASESRATHDHFTASNLRLPQPGGPDSCIYIPRNMGGTIIPPGTGL